MGSAAWAVLIESFLRHDEGKWPPLWPWTVFTGPLEYYLSAITQRLTRPRRGVDLFFLGAPVP